MSAEVDGFRLSDEPARTGKRCRYCARLIVAEPTEPDEATVHCESKNCIWCGECAAGETSVSPLAKRNVA